jgi:hypothetical protein
MIARLSRAGRAPLTYLFLAAITVVAAAIPAMADQPFDNQKTICADAIDAEERRSRIPGRLMAAIAAVESGRWDRETGANIAWPWTVTSGGEGKFYPTKQAAIRAVETLQRRGVRNIDVGCMQINLGYHPDAFGSLEEAFDPATNVAYAAAFLHRLKARTRGWLQAVRFYHSSDPDRQRYYGNKVFKARQEIRVREARERRARRVTTTVASDDASAAPERAASRPFSGITAAHWPPRNYAAQRRLELRARNWAFNRRAVPAGR